MPARMRHGCKVEAVQTGALYGEKAVKELAGVSVHCSEVEVSNAGL